jgi:hypothetical protein
LVNLPRIRKNECGVRSHKARQFIFKAQEDFMSGVNARVTGVLSPELSRGSSGTEHSGMLIETQVARAGKVEHFPTIDHHATAADFAHHGVPDHEAFEKTRFEPSTPNFVISQA